MSRARTPPPVAWPQLAFDGWLLMGEVSMVMWLRSLRLMAGGPLATREAHRMISEKFLASMTLMPALMAGGLNQTPEALGAVALVHYGKPVRANNRRLSRVASKARR